MLSVTLVLIVLACYDAAAVKTRKQATDCLRGIQERCFVQCAEKLPDDNRRRLYDCFHLEDAFGKPPAKAQQTFKTCIAESAGINEESACIRYEAPVGMAQKPQKPVEDAIVVKPASLPSANDTAGGRNATTVGNDDSDSSSSEESDSSEKSSGSGSGSKERGRNHYLKRFTKCANDCSAAPLAACIEGCETLTSKESAAFETCLEKVNRELANTPPKTTSSFTTCVNEALTNAD